VIAYVDSSVVLRFVLDQPDRLEEARHFSRRLTSLLTQIECLRGVDAMRHRDCLSDEEFLAKRAEVFTQLRRMQRVVPTLSVFQRAGDPFPVSLRTLDAIHLATALRLREGHAPDLVFATHDRRLGAAARVFDFEVVGC